MCIYHLHILASLYTSIIYIFNFQLSTLVPWNKSQSEYLFYPILTTSNETALRLKKVGRLNYETSWNKNKLSVCKEVPSAILHIVMPYETLYSTVTVPLKHCSRQYLSRTMVLREKNRKWLQENHFLVLLEKKPKTR